MGQQGVYGDNLTKRLWGSRLLWAGFGGHTEVEIEVLARESIGWGTHQTEGPLAGIVDERPALFCETQYTPVHSSSFALGERQRGKRVDCLSIAVPIYVSIGRGLGLPVQRRLLIFGEPI